MIQYILQFIVYTLAMVGVLVIGFVVCKKTNLTSPQRKNPIIRIQDMLRLPDRKTLYVINCEGEQFLVAASVDSVNLISKLNEKGSKKRVENSQIERYLNEKNIEQALGELPAKDESGSKKQIIRSLLKELSDKNQSQRGNY